VETDAGIYGLGESGLSSREQAVMGALRHYREFLIGQDPLQRGRIWQELYRSQYFEGGRVLLAAQSAIDIALRPWRRARTGTAGNFHTCGATTGR
jgi:galactonate dehydratase